MIHLVILQSEISKKTSLRKFQHSLGIDSLKLAVPNKYFSKIRIGTDSTGKPFVAGSSLFCSISHSSNLAVAICSRTPVGVDVEAIRKRTKTLLHYISNKKEISRVSPHLSVTWIWTAKESILKAVGKGISYPMKKVRLKIKSGQLFGVIGTLTWEIYLI